VIPARLRIPGGASTKMLAVVVAEEVSALS
jgi:hypothetical protein